MNAQELYVKSTAHEGLYVGSKIWMCGKCFIVHSGAIHGQPEDKHSEIARKKAEDCCAPCECGADKERTRTRCDECAKKWHDEKDQKLCDGAEEVTDLKGFDGMFYDGKDRFYHEVDDVFDDYYNGSPPEFLFLTTPIHPMKIDCCEDIYLRIDEQSEVDVVDCRDRLEGMKELEEAIHKFNEANKVVVLGWAPDYTRKVRVSDKS